MIAETIEEIIKLTLLILQIFTYHIALMFTPKLAEHVVLLKI